MPPLGTVMKDEEAVAALAAWIAADLVPSHVTRASVSR
jgi:hypothetical protein